MRYSVQVLRSHGKRDKGHNFTCFSLLRFNSKISSQVDSTNGPVNVDTSHIYHGEILGDAKSHVFGSLHDGVFEGKIITAKDSYYVEKARHYFPNQSSVDKRLHSVIYNEKHVDDPYGHLREGKCKFFHFYNLSHKIHTSLQTILSLQSISKKKNYQKKGNKRTKRYRFIKRHQEETLFLINDGCLASVTNNRKIS